MPSAVEQTQHQLYSKWKFVAQFASDIVTNNNAAKVAISCRPAAK